jgi:hypothetical protein
MAEENTLWIVDLVNLGILLTAAHEVGLIFPENRDNQRFPLDGTIPSNIKPQQLAINEKVFWGEG